MKKLLFIIMLGLAAGVITSCNDLTTDLNIETNTRLVFISTNLDNKFIYRWPEVNQGPHELFFDVSYSGLPLDIPLKFTFVQTNVGEYPTLPLREGEAGVTFQEEVYEIPVGQKTVTVPIKLLWDPNRAETTNGQLKYYGWETDLVLKLLNADETDGRLLVSTISIHEHHYSKSL